MSQKFEKLKTKLLELFELDKPDLDFGIYRVMHAKSAEVSQFLDKDLLPQVNAAFGQYQTADKAEIEKELAKVIAGIEAAGMDPAQSPKVVDLRAQLANEAVDIGTLESEVYDHLYSFFRRYYDQGDFLAKRVYKPGVYAIPYEGEEVTLHWANKDQYYIKTSEYLNDYAFRLRPDDDEQPMRVHFQLADAVEGEHGNVKAAEGQNRVFILAAPGASGQDFMAEEDGEQGKELAIHFQYRPATLTDWPEEERDGKKKPPAQKELSALAARRVLSVDDNSLAPWIAALGTPHVTAGGEKADYTRLEAHLRRYTARNTFDYFIHKDLGTFLRRELDFYIKNEVMNLDDVENKTAPRVEQYLSKIKVIRKIAGKIIAFLAQLENFQKKLWLKKKFVVETQYCITLDRIPKDLYPEIVINKAQYEEWTKLFAIHEIQSPKQESQTTLSNELTSINSGPLTVGFLDENQQLLLDTKFFDSAFKERLLDKLEKLDQSVDGLLVNSDNFQALRFLQARYEEQVKCVYIDPPYNTASSSIPYKNDYKHSSFAAMMQDRIDGLRRVLTKDGAIFVSIDKAERTVVEHILDDVFGMENRVEELIWAMNTNNSQAPNYSTNHEYVLVYAKDRATAEQDRSMFREPKPGFEEVMELVARLGTTYPDIASIESELKKLYQQHKIDLRDEIEAQGLEWEEEKANDPWKGLYNYSHAEYRDSEGRLVPETEAEIHEATIRIWREDNISMPATKQATSTRDADHKNYRFYKPMHPISGRPCPHPKSGWKFAYDDDDDSPDKRSFVSLDRDNRIVWGENHTKIPQLKRMLHEVETNVGKSIFTDYSDGEKQTSAMFGRSGVFLAPKHADFVSRFVSQAAKSDSIILDCFGGSGSTAHAIIKLNRIDRGSRKYVLVEMAEYFDTVLKPRVLKAVYSPDWRAGKPVSRNGVSQFIKVVRLESYEDALNNLETHRTKEQQGLLDLSQAQGADSLREQYILRYMLDVETRASQSLLNVHAFNDPTAYKLKVKRPGSDESHEVNVDLLETFNWLVGLTVKTIAAPQTFVAAFERDSEQRLRLAGRLKQVVDGPFWFRTVTGTTPDGRKALIIWRKLTGKPEEDNLVLDEWFRKHTYSTKDIFFDLIYVNGGNNLPNVRREDETWKVRLIEEDFHRLMFEAEGA
jgi:adenine-specific DNA-methyltransferase